MKNLFDGGGTGCGLRDSGLGVRDAGCGMRDSGLGTRGAGCGIRGGLTAKSARDSEGIAR